MCGSLLVKLGMPTPDRGMNDPLNRELEREREYDRDSLHQSVRTNVPLLNPQKKEVYDKLIKAIRLAFTMTINKPQGQSLSVCGLNCT